VSGTTVFSPAATWIIGVYSCSQRPSTLNWITTVSPTKKIDFDLRNPGAALLQTYTYSGPPIATCGNPTIDIASDTASGPLLPFLTGSFDATTGLISINIDKDSAVKGTYALRAVFTLPGTFNFTLGISLKVFDVCDSSTFDAAPTLSPDNQNYYIGETTSEGDLVVTAAYTDKISRTTSNVCGPYNLTATFNSAISTIIGGPIDEELVYDEELSATTFKFFGN